MVLKNMKITISSLLLCGAGMVAFHANKGDMANTFYPKAPSGSTDVSPVMETHCLGRFLIDLPKGTKIVADYTALGSKVQTFTSLTPAAFQERITRRQQELQASIHSKGGSMFVDRDDISADHVTLVSWSSEASQRVYHYEQYQYFREENVLYYFTGKGNAHIENRKMAAETQRKYSDQIRYRNASEVPKEDGFCIGEGLIMNSILNREEMNIGFFFPDHPGVSMSLMTFVTAYDMNPKPLPSSRKIRLAGNKVLRNKTREWGAAKATELLLKYKDHGKWFYQFELQVPSKGNTLDQPYLSISLDAGTYLRTDDQGELITSGFVNDKEALQLWDSVVGSLRLRPGAISSNNQTIK